MKLRFLLCVLLTSQTPQLHAQEPARAADLPPAISARIQPELDGARAEGLPTDPLVLRALEGMHRGAAPEKIATAVASLRAHLREARQLIGAPRTESEYVAAAGALASGVPGTVLERFRRDRPSASLAVPLAVVSDLVVRGVPVAEAGRAVSDLLERGADDRALLALRTSVQQDIAAGAAPRRATDQRTRGILAALPSLRPSQPVITTAPAN